MGLVATIDIAEAPEAPALSQPRDATTPLSRICVGICTIRRPGMLKNCLESIGRQEGVEHYDVRVVVVENDTVPATKPVVDAFAATSPFPVHYIHEPRRGIPFARNRVVDAALAMAADHVAFVDDDQITHPTFLAKHIEAAARDGADVVQAHIVPMFPTPRPFWATGRTGALEIVDEDRPVSERKRRAAGTCGVMFSARLIRPDGMGLRFDERIGLGRGSDSDFFSRASNGGMLIVNSRLPIVMDEIHRSRLTYWRHILGGLAQGNGHFVRYRNDNGYRAAFARYGAVSVVRFFRGIGQLAIAPLLAPFNLNGFKFSALEGGRNIFFAVGAIGGIFSLQYQYYRNIDGY
ncbi:glycosyltransferase family 2 protein [Rhodomicrobium vannielii ATCC 17100]|uniref:glycosyltransferase family 2 protein n=1 Tax=Rhodomicrobium vannielii TaxID=1069 RepID=UPI001919A0E0|nr:glycosyltransferase family 2 protein [Rhodomicrobium vannielii]MBJ7534677.1 glycosyltransferase family 2 protein [Rhodomicrobium vannielii ATCC 17100]